VILNEISTIHALDTALLAWLGQQKAVEVRDLVLNMPTTRKAAWQMFAGLDHHGHRQEGSASGAPPVAPSAARTGTHQPIVESYFDMVSRGAFEHAPGEDTPTIS